MRISDWSSDVCSSDLVDVWQFDIEDEAGRYISLFLALVVAGGTECDGPHIVRRQQLAECLPNTFIVVHNEDDTISRHHDAAFDSTGNVKMNFAPCGSFLSAHRRPPCNSTIERQIASPIPIPSRFVVTN